MTDARTGIGASLKRGNGDSPESFSPISEVRTCTLPKGSRADIDVTNFDSAGGYTEYIPGLREGGEVSFEANYDETDTTVETLETDFDGSQTPRNYQVALPPKDDGSSPLPDDTIYQFSAYVKSLQINVNPKEAIVVSGVLKVTGPVTRL